MTKTHGLLIYLITLHNKFKRLITIISVHLHDRARNFRVHKHCFVMHDTQSHEIISVPVWSLHTLNCSVTILMQLLDIGYDVFWAILGLSEVVELIRSINVIMRSIAYIHVEYVRIKNLCELLSYMQGITPCICVSR